MSTTFHGQWSDGAHLASRAVTVTCEGPVLEIAGVDAPAPSFVPLGQVRISDRLARVPRFLYLPNGASIETADNDAIDALVAPRGRHRLNIVIDWLERRSRVAAAAAVLLVASVVGGVYFGLPVAARRAAHAVPANIERQAGEASLATVRSWLGPQNAAARYSVKDHARVTAQMQRLTRARGIVAQPHIELISLGQVPNAFALPGGIFLVSNELCALATDDELAAILAHEMGHWQMRHGLQSIFSNSAALLVVSTVTGDLSTLTGFTASLPLLLLQRGYSREFEQEADDYAVETLKQAGIDPRYLATILTKLERSRPDAGVDYSYLGTHPSTDDRAKKIDPTGGFESLLKTAANETPPQPVVAAPPKSTDQASPSKAESIMFNSGRPSARKAAGTPPADVFSWLQLEAPPTPRDRMPPDYPAELRLAGVTGIVTLEFIIDQKGDVVAAEVVRSTHAGFEQAALDAVMKWKFSPGRKNGRAVNTRASIDIPFTLSEE